MAWTSVGYDGTITEIQWASLSSYLGNSYVAASSSDCAVTAVSGARQVSVAAGSLYGDGVLSTNSGAETVALTTPVNGQWYVIALRRTWATNTAALVAIAGATTTTSIPSAVPGSFPTLNTSPGVLTDQPIAWAWCNSATLDVVVSDLRKLPATATESYRYKQTVSFTSSGTFTKASYPWLRAIRVKCQGGGGAGGGTGSLGLNQVQVSGSGGGGAYAESFITDIAGLASSITVTVGAGGTGVSNAAGNQGGTTSFGSAVSAAGGFGGIRMDNLTLNEMRQGTAPQTTGTGDLVIPGCGTEANRNSGQYGVHASPKGGDSVLGAGGRTALGYGTAAGNAGAVYGGGGSGSVGGNYATAQTGGNGAAGIVIVELYA